MYGPAFLVSPVTEPAGLPAAGSTCRMRGGAISGMAYPSREIPRDHCGSSARTSYRSTSVPALSFPSDTDVEWATQRPPTRMSCAFTAAPMASHTLSEDENDNYDYYRMASTPPSLFTGMTPSAL